MPPLKPLYVSGAIVRSRCSADVTYDSSSPNQRFSNRPPAVPNGQNTSNKVYYDKDVVTTTDDTSRPSVKSSLKRCSHQNGFADTHRPSVQDRLNVSYLKNDEKTTSNVLEDAARDLKNVCHKEKVPSRSVTVMTSLRSKLPSSLKQHGSQHNTSTRVASTIRPSVQDRLNPSYRKNLNLNSVDKIAVSNSNWVKLSMMEMCSSSLNRLKDDSITLHNNSETNSSLGNNISTAMDGNSKLDETLVNAKTIKKEKPKRSEKVNAAEKAEKQAKKIAIKSKRDAKAEKRTDAGLDVIDFNDDDGLTSVELAQLRCPSEAAEFGIVREACRNNKLYPDDPELPFQTNRNIFSSDTMLRFKIIQNELDNIKKSEMKRDELAVSAFSRRMELMDENLKRSEELLRSSKAMLADATKDVDDSEHISSLLDDYSFADDKLMELLDNQFKKASVLTEELQNKL